MTLLAKTMASNICYGVFPNIACSMHRSRVQVRSSTDENGSIMFSTDSMAVDKTSIVKHRQKRGISIDKVMQNQEKVKSVEHEELELLWDDGYGSKNVKDYLDATKETIRFDGGRPRWFCPVASGRPLKDSPVLLFLPGLDGTGMGLILHEKALGKVFEVRCLHLPAQDRTPFEGLVKFVEETVRLEHELSSKPIYLVGESIGACLALSVATRNPIIDLVLILINPATSFDRSPLQSLLPILEALPKEVYSTVPYLLSFITGNPLKMAVVNIETSLPPRFTFQQLSRNLAALLPNISHLVEIIPMDTLLWKLKLLQSAAAYANSRLHAVKAEVLVLASGKDNILPSVEEAQRLKSSLQNCRIRCFKDNGHALLLEDSISLLTVIKGTCKYRRSRKLDFVSDFLPPSRREVNYAFDQVYGWANRVASSVIFSILENGKIVRGLEGIPDEGPLLLVGYHNIKGLEMSMLVEEFIREKNVLVRGLTHPDHFDENEKLGSPTSEFNFSDWYKIFGALPVTASNFFKLLSSGSHVLLYPGGAREAFHNKGEAYKLFWPDQPEFVRMAARFGAKIVPFAAVGEDDFIELVLDYNDLTKIPVVADYVRQSSSESIRVRDEHIYEPILLPKIPGRMYFLFGKPIETKGMKDMLKDKGSTNQLYMQIKSEVERNLDYLIKKREEDPYRSILDRTVYRAIYGLSHEVPTFEP